MDELLSRRALNRALLARQGLLERQAMPAIRMVNKLGGLQAQQPRPPYTGLWSRLADFEAAELTHAIAQRQLVRALFWRGTLHLLSTNDYLTWRDLLQPMLTAGMQSTLGDRVKTFHADPVLALARKCFSERPRTFTDLRAALIEAFPDADERAMGYFVRTHLNLVSLPSPEATWGYPADAEFALFGPEPSPVTAASIVIRYLSAFGPASVADFQAWSGFKSAQSLFEREKILVKFTDERKRTLYDLPDAARPSPDTPAPIRFIAEFDNLILGHADRTRIIADEHRPKVTTKNLLVLGTFLVDGFVAGIWKCERKKKEAILILTPFVKLPAPVRKELIEEGVRLAQFVEPDAGKWEAVFA